MSATTSDPTMCWCSAAGLTDTIQGPIDRALGHAQRNGPEGKVWLIRSPWDPSPEVWQAALSACDSRQSRVSQ
jgi:hypothetical protein